VRTVAEEYDRVVGVDTHAATHTMTLLTATGGVVEHRMFPNSAAGLRRALSWIGNRTQDRRCLVVVEGTGSYGAQLTEHFTQGGIVVAEAPTIPAVRPRGKDDVLDSARIGRAVLGLRLDQLCWPRAGGTRTAIRVLVSARDQMGTERTKTINSLTALVRSVDLGVDARKALTSAKITTIADWRTRDEDPAVAACRREAIRLASRIRALGRDLAANMAELRQFTAAEVPELLDLPGVGPVVAGTILLAWSHPGRVRSEAAFAALAGTSPIPASSGNTIRYRLNRGGDRQLNRMLTTTVLVRMRQHQATRDYLARRRAEGRTTKEIMRILKRYIARQIFRLLTAAHPTPTSAADRHIPEHPHGGTPRTAGAGPGLPTPGPQGPPRLRGQGRPSAVAQRLRSNP
jgi:transposase